MPVLVERFRYRVLRCFDRCFELRECLGCAVNDIDPALVEFEADLMRYPKRVPELLEYSQEFVSSSRCVAKEVEECIGVEHYSPVGPEFLQFWVARRVVCPERVPQGCPFARPVGALYLDMGSMSSRSAREVLRCGRGAYGFQLVLTSTIARGRARDRSVAV